MYNEHTRQFHFIWKFCYVPPMVSSLWSALIVLSLAECDLSGIMWYTFWIWLLVLNVMYLRTIFMPSTGFFIFHCYCVTLYCVTLPKCTHCPVEGHLVRSRLWLCINVTDIWMFVIISLEEIPGVDVVALLSKGPVLFCSSTVILKVLCVPHPCQQLVMSL